MQATPTAAPAESGEPSSDQRAYRRCLSQFGTGVTVITAQAGEARAGVTVNSFASLSLLPPLVTWAIQKASRSYCIFEAAGHFAVNILAADQIEVSRVFAAASDDKFAQVAWRTGVSGAPVLDGVLATLECDITSRHDGGDHILIVGRVRQFSRYEREPLLFVQGRYGVAMDHPGLKPAQEPQPVPLAEGTSLMVMLLHAYQAMSAEFEERRQAVGLTLAQSRVLAVLYASGAAGAGTMDLVRRAYLGLRDAEDAVADLVDRAYVERQPDATLVLTAAGRACREAILRHLQEFDARKLRGFDAAEVETVRRVLLHIIGNNGVAAASALPR